MDDLWTYRKFGLRDVRVTSKRQVTDGPISLILQSDLSSTTSDVIHGKVKSVGASSAVVRLKDGRLGEVLVAAGDSSLLDRLVQLVTSGATASFSEVPEPSDLRVTHHGIIDGLRYVETIGSNFFNPSQLDLKPGEVVLQSVSEDRYGLRTDLSVGWRGENKSQGAFFKFDLAALEQGKFGKKISGLSPVAVHKQRDPQIDQDEIERCFPSQLRLHFGDDFSLGRLKTLSSKGRFGLFELRRRPRRENYSIVFGLAVIDLGSLRVCWAAGRTEGYDPGREGRTWQDSRTYDAFESGFLWWSPDEASILLWVEGVVGRVLLDPAGPSFSGPNPLAGVHSSVFFGPKFESIAADGHAPKPVNSDETVSRTARHFRQEVPDHRSLHWSRSYNPVIRGSAVFDQSEGCWTFGRGGHFIKRKVIGGALTDQRWSPRLNPAVVSSRYLGESSKEYLVRSIQTCLEDKDVQVGILKFDGLAPISWTDFPSTVSDLVIFLGESIDLDGLASDRTHVVRISTSQFAIDFVR